MKKNIKRLFAVFICIASLPVMLFAGCTEIKEDIPESAGTEEVTSVSDFDDSRYIYSLLTEREREYYDILKTAAMNFEPRAQFPEKLDPELLRKLFIAVYYEEEEIFWLTSMFFRPSAESDVLTLTYRFDREDIPKMQEEIDGTAEKIFSGFTDDTTDYEKLLAFHDHLVLNCDFTKASEYGNTVYGGLCEGKAQCEGYAFSFDYLCFLAGIDCFTVTGTNSRGEIHAWNIVKLEDMWYHVDCTWDDPILEPADSGFIRHYYFLVNDADICGITHIPDYTYFALPVCTASACYYKREGLFAENADIGISMLEKAGRDALASGGRNAAVRFSDRRSYERAVNRLFEGKEIVQTLSNINSASDKKILEKKYVRYLNDDELIIHITMIYENE
ncbi:MAG: hypothetical protein NC120_08950 [Ruminococcus sp.]|nr:hypothetical protein [Ruminococcus sp.]